MSEQETTQKHPGGRPLLFESVEALQERIHAYFADCEPHPELVTRYEYFQKEVDVEVIDRKSGKTEIVKRLEDDLSVPPRPIREWEISQPKPYTITGLAVFLGTSRQTLINYENRDEYFDTIKGAKDRIEQYWENQLLGSHATGPIFNLKNNYGWEDTQKFDHTTKGKQLPNTIIRDKARSILEHEPTEA